MCLNKSTNLEIRLFIKRMIYQRILYHHSPIYPAQCQLLILITFEYIDFSLQFNIFDFIFQFEFAATHLTILFEQFLILK